MASFLFSALAGVLAFDFFNADDTGTGSVAARVDDLHGNGDTIEGSMLDGSNFPLTENEDGTGANLFYNGQPVVHIEGLLPAKLEADTSWLGAPAGA